MLELVSASADCLPAKAVTVLNTGPSVLDRLTAACQFTQSISVGFVESLLPDPRGLHIDYNWISNAMRPGNYLFCGLPDNTILIILIFSQDTPIERHPTHAMAAQVLESTLRRRRIQVDHLPATK
jgi:hypothetical protein